MATKILKTRLVLRNDKSTTWSSKNPILLKGEVGIEEDTRKFKIGDGVSNWNSLLYANITDLSNYYTKPAIDEIVKNLATVEYVDSKVATEIEKITQGREVATLGENGKIPAAQLPSYVDDVIEGYMSSDLKTFYDSLDELNRVIIPAESSKLYVDLTTNKTYRWSGTQYTEISPSLSLGETSSTAYAGNKGKQNADNIEALQNIIPTLQTKTDDTLQTTNKTLVGAVNELKQNQTLHDTNIQTNTNDITKIKQDITAANTAISSNFNRITDLEGEVDESFIQIEEINNKIESGELSDFIDVEELPSATVETKVTVPNKGYIDKVYFNTDLSTEEIETILSRLTYDSNMMNSNTLFASKEVIPDSFGMPKTMFVAIGGDGMYALLNFSTMEIYWANQLAVDVLGPEFGIEGITAGWQNFDNPIIVDNYANIDINGDGSVMAGVQNELIKDLFYTQVSTPNPDIDLSKIYRVSNYSSGGGTTVPNTGIVGKVYLNTSMSDEEIETILSQLTYDPNLEYLNIWVGTADMSYALGAMGAEGAYGILNPVTQKVYWANQIAVDLVGSNFGVTTAGWQTFDNPVEVNLEVVSSTDMDGDGIADVSFGIQNELIKGLFYTEPLIDGELSGYQYYRLINGEWVEVLSNVSPDFINVDELPGIYTGSTVPNTGIVGKVYFNTDLSDEQIETILSKLTYIEEADYMNAWLMVPDEDGNPIQSIIAMGLNGAYGILDFVSGKVYWANQAAVDLMGADFGVTQAGWQTFDNPVEINAEVLAEFEGITLGTQNELIKDLFSTTPFGLNPDLDLSKIYRVASYSSGGGAVVPNSGTVGKVYFNTDMSNEEVLSLLNQLTYNEGLSLLLSNDSVQIAAMSLNGTTGIVDFSTNTVYWVNQAAADNMGVTAGWQTFSNPIEINAEVVSTSGSFSVGAQNDLIKKLFYTEPLEEAGLIGYTYYRILNGKFIEVLGEADLSSIEIKLTSIETSLTSIETNLETKVTMDEVNEAIATYMTANYDNGDVEEY